MEEVTEEVVTGGMTAITGAFATVTSCAEAVWDFVVANPYLCVFCAAGLLSLGFGLFRKARGIAG